MSGLKLCKQGFVFESGTRAMMPHLSGLSVDSAMVSEVKTAAVTLPTGLATTLHAASLLDPILLNSFSPSLSEHKRKTGINMLLSAKVSGGLGWDSRLKPKPNWLTFSPWRCRKEQMAMLKVI